MLYDQRWDRKPTLSGFADWLEAQPTYKEYNFSCRNCALGQYLASLGITYDRDWTMANWQIDHDWNSFVTFDLPRTYGAAAKRARKMIGVPHA